MLELIINTLPQVGAWLLPRLCACCGFSSEDLQIDLCAQCRSNLPWLDDRCYQCGLLLLQPTESVICNKCQSTPPPFTRLCALFAYKPPITKLISSLKFGQQLYPGALFGYLLAEAVAQRWYVTQPLPQLIIPVPLHIQRHRKRGYNQAAEISLPIAKRLGIPLGLDVCERVKYTKAQSRLNRAQRTRNLKAAFSVNLARKVQRVAVVDDVVTTGSTVRAVCGALREAGVDCIDVWCVCRA